MAMHLHFDVSLDKTVLGTYSDTHSGSKEPFGQATQEAEMTSTYKS